MNNLRKKGGMAMPGTLYLVPTPIGNLSDLSSRAIETLSNADFIAAEDTRVTLKLLNHFSIKKPMMAYYRHNTVAGGQAILKRLLDGETCALVSDAGTPAVSDPGEDLVKLCVAHGIHVIALPGPCALTTALSVSGLSTGRFTFEGFLAMNKKNRRDHLNSLRDEPRTMIFYEAPHKLLTTLQDLCDIFGPERPISLCRELTKLHEEIIRTTMSQAIKHYQSQPPKGEFVLVVAGAQPCLTQPPDLNDALAQVALLRRDGISLKDAVRQVADSLGLKRNLLYSAVLEAEKH